MSRHRAGAGRAGRRQLATDNHSIADPALLRLSASLKNFLVVAECTLIRVVLQCGGCESQLPAPAHAEPVREVPAPAPRVADRVMASRHGTHQVFFASFNFLLAASAAGPLEESLL
ncbi:hypothetical protein EVAR_14887_1 [Eumeta japonica]|uniref:Uncharacterized protein n=1 Tax=Eumeta variegata TaxID=151549 RepID=A0A4C1V4A6_EUMVA|nr:hypothetical protein EVAR_14887_1 [Eumeta japonica]